MTGDALPFGPGELLMIACYLSSLLVIGWISRRARRKQSMDDFYLAGRGVGFLVLLLTLYATQYSGNTLFGFTGKTYVIGYAWVVCLHFMTAIVVFYLLLAPKLHWLSRRFDFVTPSDFIQHRFRLRLASVLATATMVVALAIYLLAQLKAMGEALRGFMPQHGDEAYIWGVVILALVIVVYETLGGFRAVAWTDVVQGTSLMIGFTILLLMVFQKYGSLSDATRILSEVKPSLTAPPNSIGALKWASWIFLVDIGGALYPQAIQRIYAAKSARSLRGSLAVMAFLPLATTLVAVIFGVMAAAYVPGFEVEPDKILTVVCREIQQQGVAGRMLVVLLFAAILAALMSTADSVLLSVSSMITKDFYAPLIRPEASDAELTRVGKMVSWTLISVATILAIAFKNTDLVTLLKVKFDLIVQLAPMFFLGLHWTGLRSGPVLAGMLIGLTVAVGLIAAGHGEVAGIHAGNYGLLANLVAAIGLSVFLNRTAPL